MEIIYLTLHSHTNTVISHIFAHSSHGVENRDKVYSVLDSLTNYKPVLLLRSSKREVGTNFEDKAPQYVKQG